MLLALLAIAGTAAYAQDAGPAEPPAEPVLADLETNWWTYFEGSEEEVARRTDEFLDGVSAQLPDLDTQNREAAGSLLGNLRDNLTAYRALLDETDVELKELPPPALSYTLDDLLRLAATARNARSGASQAQVEVEREQRVREGVSRRRDLAFKNYVDAAPGDERFLAALRLLQARSALAISARRIELLEQSHLRAAEYADATATRVDLARQNLALDADAGQVDALTRQVSVAEATLAQAEDAQRAAEIAASTLNLDTERGRLEQRLAQQKLVDSDVTLALARVSLAKAQARRWWTELRSETDPDLGVLEEQALDWSELVRTASQSRDEWQRDTEDELLAVQSVVRDNLDRASRRLLDQRLGTAQGTLNRIAELEASVADLELLGSVVDSAIADSTGALRSWLASANRNIKSGYRRVTGLADATLFSIGETPVTGGDILRVLIIMLVAFLLSRGVRLAIKRFSESESTGTQASLYTVGRLTHYTIIVIAVVVALSSIGLDFTNLALVAGALSVGIGFGLQSIVSNFVSGLIILFEHTLRVGDYIELDTGLTGTVKSINVRSTLINTNDNIDVVVPNSEFVSNRLTNWTLGEHILRVRIPFGVAYGTDKELVKKAAMEAVSEVPYTITHMKGREPDVWLVEFGDSSLNFLLLVWVNRQGARRPTRTRATYLWALETKLNEYGIEIPFPQRDLHMRSGWSRGEA